MAKKKKPSQQDLDAQKEILRAYVELIKERTAFPSRGDMRIAGISRDRIRHHFGSMKGLRDAAKKAYPAAFKGVVSHDDYNAEQMDKLVAKNKKFIITTAVNGQKANKNFLRGLDQLAAEHGAQILVLPCNDPAHNLDNEVEWHFDAVMNNYNIVFEELYLNDRIHISDFPVNAKQVNPTLGLSRITQGRGSFIFASPKQMLEYDAVPQPRMPHARMSTGACTIPNYKSSRGNSKRNAFIAEHDHMIGAIFVEIVDEKMYHFTQVRAESTGIFSFFGKRYNGARVSASKPSLIMGDYHAGEHEEAVVKGLLGMIDEYEIEDVFIHDMFNGLSINHHEDDNIVVKARRAKNGQLSLEEELRTTFEQVNRITSKKSVKKVHWVMSNHEEFLHRYLQQGRFQKDFQNMELAFKILPRMIDGENPIKVAADLLGVLTHPEKIVWLSRHDSVTVGGYECGAHGDKGPNGTKGSVTGLEKAYGKCIRGHTHTPGIMRGVITIGTTSKKQLGYNVGPSSWMHTSALAYEDTGSAQLVNFIMGRYRG